MAGKGFQVGLKFSLLPLVRHDDEERESGIPYEPGSTAASSRQGEVPSPPGAPRCFSYLVRPKKREGFSQH